MTTTIVRKTTDQLRPGDLVLTHGMRVRIGDDLHQTSHPVEVIESADAVDYRGPTYASRGLVENVDEVLEAGMVPESWLLDGEWVDGVGWVMVRPHRWTIQGNRLASWAVVVEDEAR